jgi:hypothetical protein
VLAGASVSRHARGTAPEKPPVSRHQIGYRAIARAHGPHMVRRDRAGNVQSKKPVSARRVCAQQVYGLRRACAPQQVCGLRRVCARQQPSSPRSPRHSRPKSLQATRRDHWPGSKRLRTREREPCHKPCRQQHRVFRFHYSFLLFEDCASKIRFEGRMMNGPFGQLERVAHLSHA